METLRTIAVIIGFKNRPNESDIEMVTKVGGAINRIYKIINAISANVPENAIDTIRKNPRVEYIEIDEKVFAHRIDSRIPIGTCQEIKVLKQMVPWGINRIGARIVNNLTGNTGQGIKVAILDTGIDKDHEDLSKNFKGGYNFVDNNIDLTDLNGHGCCHPDTKLFTTLCGLNRIEYFYNHIDSHEVLNEDGSKTKSLNDDIYTISICSYDDNNDEKQKQSTLNSCFGLNLEEPNSRILRKLEKRKIESIHKIPIKNDKLVQINDIVLTPWHRCFIFDKDRLQIEEKRADNIVAGDYLISPGKHIELNNYRNDTTVCLGIIDENLSYLLGAITGDGHVSIDLNRIDLSLDSIEVANKCVDICHKLRYRVTSPEWQEEKNYYRVIIYSKKLTMYCYDNIKTSSIDVKIPDIIIKSPFDVLISFISGLIDTDKNIKDGGTRIRISSSSKEGIIDKLYNILSVIGLQPGIIKIADAMSYHYLKGKLIRCTVPNYQIVFHADTIGDKLMKYMTHKKKKDLLKIQLNKNNSIPISQRQLRRYLELNYGIMFNSNHRCVCCNRIRLGLTSDIISKHRLKEIFEIIGHKEDNIYQIADNFNFTSVVSIEKKEYDGYFYDLTMEDSNNYVAGLSDMVFIHNTHVAGIIAAEDNDIGVVGVAPGAHIYSVKVLDYAASGSASNMVAGMEWVVENKMHIVNMSLGSEENSISFRRSIENTYNDGIIIVAAAGNSGNIMGNGDCLDYPAKYNEVVSVGATDINDKRARFSSTGPSLEISAPGVDIPSTLPRNKYGTLSGTSMSCPHVAGVAALVKKANPGMTNIEIRVRLQVTAQNIAKNGFLAKKDWYGFGLVDAVKAASL